MAATNSQSLRLLHRLVLLTSVFHSEPLQQYPITLQNNLFRVKRSVLEQKGHATLFGSPRSDKSQLHIGSRIKSK